MLAEIRYSAKSMKKAIEKVIGGKDSCGDNLTAADKAMYLRAVTNDLDNIIEMVEKSMETNHTHRKRQQTFTEKGGSTCQDYDPVKKNSRRSNFAPV